MPTAPCSTPAGARDLPADSCAEWLELFRELQIPAPWQTPAAPFDDLHFNAIGFFSGTSGHVARPGPLLGADTAEVLEELGLAPDTEQAAPHESA
jgi:crotonobetainyl-CoA:carnitine CoA-transferase CaiB-like acyl-CoA transferase